MTAPRAAETTGGRRPRDLVLSLAVLLVPIVLVILLFQFLGGDRNVTVVDPGPAVAEARRTGLDAAEPRGLPEGWRSTSAVVRPRGGTVTLRIGYVSPSGGFLQLVQSNRDAEPVLRRELGGTRPPDGRERIDGRDWQTYPARNGERALVLLEPERTTVVVGRAPGSELRRLAAAVR